MLADIWTQFQKKWHSFQPMTRMLLCVGAAVLLFGFIKYRHMVAQIAMHGDGSPPPQAIIPYVVQEREWREHLELVGTLSPVQGVILRAEEEGRVASVEVASGAMVMASQQLFSLDTSVERAALAAAEARRDLARLTRTRNVALRKELAVSESSLDTASAGERELSAEVQRLAALIQRKTIVAPFAGQLGIRQINVGDYVQRGATLASLNNLDSLYLNISVPERYLGSMKVGEPVSFSVDSEAQTIFQGVISAVDPEIDPTTRAIRVQASVDNHEHRLRPGMFARVGLEVGEAKKLPTVPLTAILYASYGDTVYVIEAGPQDQPRPVRQQFVTLGVRQGEQVAIASGLTAGQEIVAVGGFKLGPGMKVIPRPDVPLRNEASPKPANS